jgi:P27 family predicted phage terminase small subunit
VKPDATTPACPSWLDAEAQAEWADTAPKLERLGLLTEVDGPAFAIYCASFAAWKKAERVVAEEGATFTTEKGYVCVHPQVAIARSQKEAALKALAHFGMTPSSRAGLKVQPPRPADDPLAPFLEGG